MAQKAKRLKDELPPKWIETIQKRTGYSKSYISKCRNRKKVNLKIIKEIKILSEEYRREKKELGISK